MVPPPPNDNFNDAQVIAATPYENTVDVTGASREPDEPSNCTFGGPTVWYSFTPTETQFAVAASTSGSVAVYQADAADFTGLTLLSCAFSGGVEFQATGGTTYLIQVGSQLSLTEPPAPPGDEIATSTPIGDGPRSFTRAPPHTPPCAGGPRLPR